MTTQTTIKPGDMFVGMWGYGQTQYCIAYNGRQAGAGDGNCTKDNRTIHDWLYNRPNNKKG